VATQTLLLMTSRTHQSGWLRRGAEEGARGVGARSESDQIGHRGDTDQSTGLNDRSATNPVIPQHRNRIGRPHVWS
jgi:hypothetical protein